MGKVDNIHLQQLEKLTGEGVTNSDSSKLSSDEEQDKIDPIESIVGGIGRWQIIICLSIAMLKIPVAFHQLSIIFLAPPVNFTCVNPPGDVNGCAANCTEYAYNSPIFNNTIVTEWDLICGKDWKRHMTQTVFMFGVLVGNAIFGSLADRYGRRKPLLIAVFFQTITGILASVCVDWYSFTVVRFALAIFTGGTMVIGFVMTMEMVGIKYRQPFSMIFQIPFNIGHALMVGIAYLTRDSWHKFQLWLSLPTILLLSYYWLVPESPIWLLTVGKTSNAIKILTEGAKRNDLPTEDISKKLEAYRGDVKVKRGNIISLFRTPNMRKKTLFLCFGWLSCGLSFFGVSQYIGQLVGSIFVNVLVSALIQIPGTVMVIFLNNWYGRKKTLIGTLLLSGIPLVAIGIIPKSWEYTLVTLSLIGIFGSTMNFSTIYLFAAEIFPTVLRNTGMGLCSMLARFGSMIAPFIAGLDTVQYWLPPVIFGGLPLIAAIFTVFLPETHGRVLPNTLDDAENFERKASRRRV